MKYELFLAVRYLKGLRAQPVVSVIAGISVLGIALGVAALFVVLGVMSGFDADLEGKIIGANPHLLVQADGGVRDPEGLIRELTQVAGVVAAAPVLQTQVALQREGEVQGVLLRGVDPQREASVTRLAESMKEGGWPPAPGELFIGADLARRLRVEVGDSVSVVGAQPKGKGKRPQEQPFRVGGIFSVGMYDYDMHLALASLESVRAIFPEGPAVSGVQVRLNEAVRAPQAKQEIQRRLGYPYWVMSWMDLNSSLFAALRIEKVTMFVILTLIVLVACFNVIATLLMMVVGKTKEIGILKAVGATAASTRRIFTFAGLLIGLAGTALGTAVGVGLCAALARYRFIRLPADIYTIDRLPVKLETGDAVSVAAAALAISWAACLYPAWVAARLSPAQALRYE